MHLFNSGYRVDQSGPLLIISYSHFELYKVVTV